MQSECGVRLQAQRMLTRVASVNASRATVAPTRASLSSSFAGFDSCRCSSPRKPFYVPPLMTRSQKARQACKPPAGSGVDIQQAKGAAKADVPRTVVASEADQSIDFSEFLGKTREHVGRHWRRCPTTLWCRTSYALLARRMASALSRASRSHGGGCGPGKVEGRRGTGGGGT